MIGVFFIRCERTKHQMLERSSLNKPRRVNNSSTAQYSQRPSSTLQNCHCLSDCPFVEPECTVIETKSTSPPKKHTHHEIAHIIIFNQTRIDSELMTHTHTHTHTSESQVTKKVPPKRGTGLRRCIYTNPYKRTTSTLPRRRDNALFPPSNLDHGWSSFAGRGSS